MTGPNIVWCMCSSNAYMVLRSSCHTYMSLPLACARCGMCMLHIMPG